MKDGRERRTRRGQRWGGPCYTDCVVDLDRVRNAVWGGRKLETWEYEMLLPTQARKVRIRVCVCVIFFWCLLEVCAYARRAPCQWAGPASPTPRVVSPSAFVVFLGLGRVCTFLWAPALPRGLRPQHRLACDSFSLIHR